MVFENLIVFPREIQLPQDVLISKVSGFLILHKKEDTEKEITVQGLKCYQVEKNQRYEQIL